MFTLRHFVSHDPQNSFSGRRGVCSFVIVWRTNPALTGKSRTTGGWGTKRRARSGGSTRDRFPRSGQPAGLARVLQRSNQSLVWWGGGISVAIQLNGEEAGGGSEAPAAPVTGFRFSGQLAGLARELLRSDQRQPGGGIPAMRRHGRKKYKPIQSYLLFILLVGLLRLGGGLVSEVLPRQFDSKSGFSNSISAGMTQYFPIRYGARGTFAERGYLISH